MSSPKHTRENELKSFDDTKSGVGGLVKSGITKVPKIFIDTRNDSPKSVISDNENVKFPLFDLESVDEDLIRRKAVVDGVREASSTWGFFQVINHGIPGSILERMIDRTRGFFELEEEEKKKWYTRDEEKTFIYNSNFDLFNAPSANWRDTAYCEMTPRLPSPEELPDVCRDTMVEFSKHILSLGRSLFQILSEALGLKTNHLVDMKCAEGVTLLLHYYPKCPEPELTLGTSRHADSDFLTVVLNDQVSGLQVLHRNQWVNVPPLPGALVVNIGDLLQLVSNDRFISAEHRVLANNVSTRVSIACFFRNVAHTEPYRPIKELVYADSPAKYRATTIKDYVKVFNSKGLDGTSALSRFRV